jgi:hypothetical protein
MLLKSNLKAILTLQTQFGKNIMTYLKIVLNIHVNIISLRKKIIYIYNSKNIFPKKQWSKGAHVTPYSMVRPYYLSFYLLVCSW